jgi:5,10-methylenetetrahydromethanopterin reductase
MPLTFGLSMLGALPPRHLLELAKRAEQAGFREILVPDVVLRGPDVFCSLTLIAAGTSLRFGPGVSHPYTRHLAVTVNAIRTLEELAPGRAVLGLGSGGGGIAEVGARRASLDELRATLELARRLLAGETITAAAPPAFLDRARLRFPPAPVPIWFAATGPRMLQLAGEIADGALVHVGAAAPNVRFAAEQVDAGRASAGVVTSFEASLYAYASTSEDPGTILRECRVGVANVLGRYPGYAKLAGCAVDLPPGDRPTPAQIEPVLDVETVRRLAITGGTTAWLDRLAELEAAGLRRVLLVTTIHEAELIDRAGSEIIPRFS